MAALSMFDASDDVVEIHVASGENTFSIHRSLLLKASDYFRSIVSISESSDSCFQAFGPVAVFTNVPGAAVRAFVQWLYTGQLNPNAMPTHIGDVLRLFKWTDTQLHNTGFRDYLVDKTIELVANNTTATAGDVYAILDHLDDANGGMLMFLTDFIVHSKLHQSTLYAEIGEHLAGCKNADAIYRAIASSFLEAKVDGDTSSLPPWQENRCQYHEHAAITCCSKAPGVILAESSELRTPPPAPKKKRKFTQPVDDPFEEIVVVHKKSPQEVLQTPTRFTRSTLRPQIAPTPKLTTGRGRTPNWSIAERIAALKLYLQYPDLGHNGIAEQLSRDYCAIRGYARSGGAMGMQYRETMGGNLEETRSTIPAKIAELEVEAPMEIDEEEFGGIL